MKSKNPVFETSLACLQHPLTLLSIVVLLLNDHILKVVSPSWLTGKISDFAGLFFFPFIVAAGLSFALAKFNLSRQRIGQIAFGIVTIWFVLLKTFPFINSLTERFASLFIGAPARLIMDWTDLIALISMWPAWMMWKQPRIIKPSRFAYAILTIGMLATLATSPKEPTIYSVTDLSITKDGILYAADKDGCKEEWFPVAVSKDGGLTWELDYKDEHMQDIDPKTYPVEDCFLGDSLRICYRVTGKHQLEIANDSYGGEINWQEVFDSNDLKVKARDLLIISWEGKEYLIVAIGEAGILRRELPYGNWENIKVLGAGTW